MPKRHDFPQGKRKFRDAKGRFRPMDITDIVWKAGSLQHAVIKITKTSITELLAKADAIKGAGLPFPFLENHPVRWSKRS